MPEGRARAQARPLLFLSALDAIIFLAAVAVNLETLPLSSSDLIQTLLIWSAVVLIAASAIGFAGGIWLGKESPSRIVVTAAAVVNGVLVAAVATYYPIAANALSATSRAHSMSSSVCSVHMNARSPVFGIPKRTLFPRQWMNQFHHRRVFALSVSRKFRISSFVVK